MISNALLNKCIRDLKHVMDTLASAAAAASAPERPSRPEPEPRKLRQSQQPGINMNDMIREARAQQPKPPRSLGQQRPPPVQRKPSRKHPCFQRKGPRFREGDFGTAVASRSQHAAVNDRQACPSGRGAVPYLDQDNCSRVSSYSKRHGKARTEIAQGRCRSSAGNHGGRDLIYFLRYGSAGPRIYFG
jgi:hypothetical protein